MAHLTMKSAYSRLAERINRFPQGAPPTELLFSILKMLYSEHEAGLVALLPIKPFPASTAAKLWKVDLSQARKTLDHLADRGLLVDIETEDASDTYYVMPPPMAGFFEFSMMRVRADLDQKALSEMFYQYLNVEEDFVKALFTNGETQLGRILLNEGTITPELSLHVLDYERASEVIKSAKHIGIGVCYCRHKMEHLGRACGAPRNICMTFAGSAYSLIKHGIAREVDASECLALLDEAQGHNLVQFAENVRQGVGFICNCCGCCCEAMLAQRRFGTLHPIHTSNYQPRVKEDDCIGCDKCTNACPVEAMALVSANDPHHPRKKKARYDLAICLGCGVCARVCPKDAIAMEPRGERVITPLNTMHRTVVMAIERGKLQNLLFDQQALMSHRALAAIFGVILQLPPLKRAMASKQMKSRYLEKLLEGRDMVPKKV